MLNLQALTETELKDSDFATECDVRRPATTKGGRHVCGCADHAGACGGAVQVCAGVCFDRRRAGRSSTSSCSSSPALGHGDLQRSRSKAGLPEHKGRRRRGPRAAVCSPKVGEERIGDGDDDGGVQVTG